MRILFSSLFIFVACQVSGGRIAMPRPIPDDMPQDQKKLIKQAYGESVYHKSHAINVLGERKEKSLSVAPWLVPLLNDRTKCSGGRGGRSWSKIGRAPGIQVITAYETVWPTGSVRPAGPTTTIARLTERALKNIFKDKPKLFLALYKNPETVGRDFMTPLMCIFDDPECQELFLKGFTHPNENIRWTSFNEAALCYTRKIGNLKWRPKVYPIAEKILKSDSSSKVRMQAIVFLSGKKGNNDIIAAYVHDKDWIVQFYALRYLAAQKDPRGLNALKQIIIKGKDTLSILVNADIAFNYGPEGHQVLIEGLRNYPRSRDGILRSSRLGRKIVKAKSPEIVAALCYVMLDNNPRDYIKVDKVLKEIRNYTLKDMRARNELFVLIRTKLLNMALPILKSGNYTEKINALTWLGKFKIKDERLFAALVPLTKSKNSEIRKRSILALGSQGKKAVQPLLSILKNTSQPDAKAMAIISLDGMKYKDAVSLVTDELTNFDNQVRHVAVKYLAQYHDDNVLKKLRYRLNDSDGQIAWAAYYALKKAGTNPPRINTAINYDFDKDEFDLSLKLYLKPKSQNAKTKPANLLRQYSLKYPKQFTEEVKQADKDQLEALVRIMISAGGKNNSKLLIEILNSPKPKLNKQYILYHLQNLKNASPELILIVTKMVLEYKLCDDVFATAKNSLIAYAVRNPESQKIIESICYCAIAFNAVMSC